MGQWECSPGTHANQVFLLPCLLLCNTINMTLSWHHGCRNNFSQLEKDQKFKIQRVRNELVCVSLIMLVYGVYCSWLRHLFFSWFDGSGETSFFAVRNMRHTIHIFTVWSISSNGHTEGFYFNLMCTSLLELSSVYSVLNQLNCTTELILLLIRQSQFIRCDLSIYVMWDTSLLFTIKPNWNWETDEGV